MRPGAAGCDEGFHVIAAEHFQVQLLFRLHRITVLVQAEVANQIAGLDCHGPVKHHHAIQRQRFAPAIQ
ncbi:hypothetical protein D3C76_844470 [compost metagenome]